MAGVQIDERAIVHPKAQLGENITVGPFSVIGENAVVGDNCIIHNGVTIKGYTTIGKNNEFHPYASIGGPPQDLSWTGEESYSIIGDNNCFREYSSVHPGTKPGTKTIIGNNCYFMVGAHAGHNTTFGDKVILVNYASIGGHCVIGKGVFMSASVAVHQFCKVGDYCMVGGCSKISKDVPPFMIVQQDGFDVSVFGLNVVGLRRAGIESEDRKMIKRAYMTLYHKGLTVSKAIEAIKADGELMKNTYVLQMVEFLEKSDRGITRHHAK